MGQVYLAEDTSLDRQVALKFLPQEMQADETARKRFQREAKSAAALDHPFICHIHEIGEAEGRGYIAMEYVQGETLRDKLVSGPVTVKQTLQITSEIAEALEKAHQSGIVHRDLKPSNIMITPEGHVKVMDFGLAKRVVSDLAGTEEVQLTTLTKEGSTVGTIPYMSPEQLKGKEVDTRSDIFSFGIILYEMLTGVHPFLRAEAMETASAILTEAPPPLARHREGLPEILQHTVKKMLAKERSGRCQSAQEVLDDLDRSELRFRVQGVKLGHWTGRWRAAGLAACIVLIMAVSSILLWPPGLEVANPETEVASVVALPAQIFGPSELSYLTGAVPSTLSSRLVQVEGLEIKLPPTSLQVERLGGDVERIAAAYGAGVCVTSSITAVGDQLVLAVQLVEPESREILWSQEYEGQLANYLDLMRRAADGVRLALLPQSAAPGSQTQLTSDSGAELAFRQGQHYSARYNRLHQMVDFEVASGAFQRALQLDPQLGAAATEMAWLFMFRIEGDLPPQEGVAEAATWISRALEIGPISSRLLVVQGALESMHPSPSRRKILEYSLRAFSLDVPGGIGHFGVARAVLSCTLGLAAARESVRLDPLYLYNSLGEASYLSCLDRPEEALKVIDSLLRTEPDFTYGLGEKMAILVELGRLDEAAQIVERLDADRRRGGLREENLVVLRVLLSLTRRDQASVGVLIDRLADLVNNPQTPAVFFFEAATGLLPVLARAGEIELALEFITRSVEVGVLPYDFLRLHPDLTRLHADPRFSAALARARIQFEEVLEALQNVRRAGHLPAYLEQPIKDLNERLGLEAAR